MTMLELVGGFQYDSASVKLAMLEVHALQLRDRHWARAMARIRRLGSNPVPIEGNMRFRATRLEDVRLIELEPARDERGSFTRTFCARELGAAGLATVFVQHSFSHTERAGTVRGMHFQRAPHEEVKLIRCVAGAIYDVLIDIRPVSPTYMQWEAYELAAGDGRQLYVPTGFAHGFQTLAPATEVAYMMTAFYAPESAAGIRHDDPAFKLAWPLPVAEISVRDRAWPDYRP
jgi:dTDP-4-dehydrorhamnose 3,5-epimerase